MVIQCCACKRVRQENRWIEVNEPERVSQHASHGYCPPCADKATAEFERVAQLMSNARVRPAA